MDREEIEKPSIKSLMPSLHFEGCPSLPMGMINAQTVSLKGTLYVGGGFTEGNENDDARLYSCKPGVDSTWTVLNTPTYWYALAIHDSQLLLVGGSEFDSGHTTNKIYTLVDQEFVEILPPMIEKRYAASAVSSGSALIVAGGCCNSEDLFQSVEVFNNGEWMSAPPLPAAGYFMQSARHDDDWYLINNQSGYVCHVSLPSLYETDQSPWETLPHLPNIMNSAAAFFGGYFLSIGGGWPDPKSTIHAYSAESQSWEHVADLPISLSCLSAEVLPSGELRIVGGRDKNGITKKVFKVLEKSKQPTNPSIWEGLFNILKRMRQVAEQIRKSVTGSPFDPNESAERKVKGPSVVSEEGAAEKKDPLPEIENKIDQLTDENARLTDEVTRLTVENDQLSTKLIQSFPPEQGARESQPSSERVTGYVSEPLSDSMDETGQHSLSGQPVPDNMETPFNLPGVEVVGQTSVILTNSAQSFHWAGYGFKLHIPQDSLPSGVDQCRLDIIASVAGQYQFPENQELVSAVYWVQMNPQCRFQHQLTVELQHCAKMTSSTKLTFVKTVHSQESLPYKFKKLEGCGSFAMHSSYGMLPLSHFCGLAVAGVDVERLYTASLYYLEQGVFYGTEIHLVVTWNDKVHINDVKRRYRKKRAREGAYIAVEFEKEISLDIPMPDGVTSKDKHWRICPLATPILTKGEVDSFNPGQMIPCLQLKAKPIHKEIDKIPELSYLLKLTGAKEPKNEMVIEIEPKFEDLRFGTYMYALDSAALAQGVVNPHNTLSIPDRRMAERSGQYFLYPEMAPHQHTSYCIAPFGSTFYPIPYPWMPGGITGDGHMNIVGQSSVSPGSTCSIEYPAMTVDQLVDHVGISRDLLNKECSTDHLRRIAALLPNWQKYAEGLGLTEQQILGIKSDALLDPEMKPREVMRLWKRANSFKATYRVLIEVCLQQQDSQLAERICSMVKGYLPPKDSSSQAGPADENIKQENVTQPTGASFSQETSVCQSEVSNEEQ